jgi:hypothetical protein
VVACEIDADEADSFCAHVECQASSDIWRVTGVRKALGIAYIHAAAPPKAKAHEVGVVDSEIQLTEDCGCLAVFDILKTISAELAARIENNKIVRLKQAAHIIDANRDKVLGTFDLAKRDATAAYQDGVVAMKIAKVT